MDIGLMVVLVNLETLMLGGIHSGLKGHFSELLMLIDGVSRKLTYSCCDFVEGCRYLDSKEKKLVCVFASTQKFVTEKTCIHSHIFYYYVQKKNGMFFHGYLSKLSKP